jgi:hypothetical protein
MALLSPSGTSSTTSTPSCPTPSTASATPPTSPANCPASPSPLPPVRPLLCHPERGRIVQRTILRSRGTCFLPALSLTRHVANWLLRQTAALSTPQRDSQANPFTPLKMTRKMGEGGYPYFGRVPGQTLPPWRTSPQTLFQRRIQNGHKFKIPALSLQETQRQGRGTRKGQRHDATQHPVTL